MGERTQQQLSHLAGSQGLGRVSQDLVLSQGWRGHSWLIPGGGGSLPPLTVDSIKKGCIPEP